MTLIKNKNKTTHWPITYRIGYTTFLLESHLFRPKKKKKRNNTTSSIYFKHFTIQAATPHINFLKITNPNTRATKKLRTLFKNSMQTHLLTLRYPLWKLHKVIGWSGSTSTSGPRPHWWYEKVNPNYNRDFIGHCWTKEVNERNN